MLFTCDDNPFVKLSMYASLYEAHILMRLACDIVEYQRKLSREVFESLLNFLVIVFLTPKRFIIYNHFPFTNKSTNENYITKNNCVHVVNVCLICCQKS